MINDNDFTQMWNEKHIEYIKQGPEVRNKLMADYCEELIITAKNAYYNTGNPIMTDLVYDKIEEYLKRLRPESKVLIKVGA